MTLTPVTLKQLWTVMRHPTTLMAALILYTLLLYITLCHPEQRRWQHSQLALTQAQQHTTTQHTLWDRCQTPLNPHTHRHLQSYLDHQITSPSEAEQAANLLHYFHDHHLSVEHYSVIEAPNDKGKQRHLYRVCGEYNNINHALLEWLTPPFRAWVQTLMIQPCQQQPSQLQLTLVLENARD